MVPTLTDTIGMDKVAVGVMVGINVEVAVNVMVGGMTRTVLVGTCVVATGASCLFKKACVSAKLFSTGGVGIPQASTATSDAANRKINLMFGLPISPSF